MATKLSRSFPSAWWSASAKGSPREISNPSSRFIYLTVSVLELCAQWAHNCSSPNLQNPPHRGQICSCPRFDTRRLTNRLQASPPRLTWSHYRALMRVDDPEARAFYEREAIAGAWDKRTLERQIQSFYYERTLKSSRPARCPSLKDSRLPSGSSDAPRPARGSSTRSAPHFRRLFGPTRNARCAAELYRSSCGSVLPRPHARSYRRPCWHRPRRPQFPS